MSGLLNGFNNGRDTTDGIGGQKPIDQIPNVSGSVFTQDEENELQRLVRKIKHKNPTIDDMKKADELTRKKMESGNPHFYIIKADIQIRTYVR